MCKDKALSVVETLGLGQYTKACVICVRIEEGSESFYAEVPTLRRTIDRAIGCCVVRL